RPAGKQVPVGDFPINIALHPGGAFAAVLHSGYGEHEIRVIDLKNAHIVSSAALEEGFYGLAWSPDGKKLFASGAATEAVHEFAFADGFLSAHREIRLRPVEQNGMPAGIAVTDDGSALYVADCLG